MYHKQLVTHISLKLREGLSIDQIKADLLNDGWTAEDIEEAYRYSMFPNKLSGFSVARFLRSEVPVSVTAGVFIISLSAVSAVFVFFRNPVYNYDISLAATPKSESVSFSYGEQPALSDPVFFEKVKNQFIEQKASFVSVDLSAMRVSVYKEGNVELEFPVKTKGREGSWWETPAGLYKINSKEANHFSEMGKVFMPWSMNFQGNFFIHGWPYYPDETPVASTYSGGCIRLATEDAKRLYDAVEVGTPILVFKSETLTDNFSYSNVPPSIGAISYLAADLKNNYVFLKGNSDRVLPIASIVKLMTALVATEYINLDLVVTVPKEAIVYTSKPRLKVGQSVSVYQLLFPLLLESSNEAAETIARAFGRDAFIRHMNEKAMSLGMKRTTFDDPSGASEKNISTTEDLFMLAKYIYDNRSFIFKITSGDLTDSAYGENQFKDIQNFNNFADDSMFIGGKVGKTNAAKETELSVFKMPVVGSADTRPIVMISIGSAESKKDVTAMRKYISENFRGK